MTWVWVTLVAMMGLSGVAGAQTANLPLHQIQLPAGFSIDLYATDVLNARSMALGSRGTLFVGTRRAGNVYALVDRDQDHVADEKFLLASGLFFPNGVAFHDGALYMAEINRILRYDQIETRLDNPPEPVVVTDNLPSDRHHGWKFIRFGPDGWLYVPVGGPCNVCTRDDPRYAAILRMRPDGTKPEVFAHGVRNSVGFDWHPATRELWFTDNGRDHLGDDLPPDELNHAPRSGLHFGFPYCHGGNLADPEFGAQRSCDEFTPPAMRLGPHVAALGMRFYTGNMFPPAYRNQIFIAEHGSWNRSSRIGYRVAIVRLDNHRAVSYDIFAQGWLQGEERWGRPADVQVMPDGALLVSDDTAGAIYRIRYEK